MEELKPCPFCGCSMEIEEDNYPNGDARIEPYGWHDDDCPLNHVLWCFDVEEDGTSPLGCCGYGSICDYCTDNDKGRPCVRALNAKAREMRIEVDYNDKDFERWFYV